MPDIIHEDVINLDVDKINFDDKEAMKGLLLQLLSTIEQLAQSNQELRKGNQQLKDEINRLKGEKGRPKILPDNPEYQANAPKEKPKKWHKDSKKPKIKSIEQNTLKLINQFFYPMPSITAIDGS